MKRYWWFDNKINIEIDFLSFQKVSNDSRSIISARSEEIQWITYTLKSVYERTECILLIWVK